MELKKLVESGLGTVGIEFGSTRIKAVLTDDNFNPVASGDYVWENQLQDGIWTYPEEQFFEGLQACFAALKRDVLEKTGVKLTKLRALGISGMMHGYLAFDKDGKILVPFRTWRNTITGDAAKELSDLFHFNVPQRWTCSHVRQAVLNREPHLAELATVHTLAGYIHYRLTGERVVGTGEASGILPLNAETLDYDDEMISILDRLNAASGYSFKMREILPKVVNAGEYAGLLTEEGARLLDPTGALQPGCIVAPPEGDAGTGMVATNSVRKRTGNVSAGTSVFSMVVLEKPLSDYYEEIDMVTTPDGAPVAMVHCNNCTSDLNAYVGLFREFLTTLGLPADNSAIYTALFNAALSGDKDCGGVVSLNYVSSEPVTHIADGRPLLTRTQDAKMTLPNFMRAQLYSAIAALKAGNDILLKKENVPVDRLFGHGGYFKTKGVGQQILADALNVPVSVMKTAGEGGPWGMAVLAAYAAYCEEQKANGEKSGKIEKLSLPDYLDKCVFAGNSGETLNPDPEGVEGFDRFMKRYQACMNAEKALTGL